MRPAASTIAALALAVLPATATAAPGAPDPSFSGDGWTRTLEARSASNRAFGAGGIAITDFGTRADEITALAAHGDKVVAAGSIYASLGLARYMTR
jgi:hypothetical protein